MKDEKPPTNPSAENVRTGNVQVRSFEGRVFIGLPAEALQTEKDRYLSMAPEQARAFAAQVLRGADGAEGKPPAHRFVIEVPRGAL